MNKPNVTKVGEGCVNGRTDHELFLTAHRENIKALERIMSLGERLAKRDAEIAELRRLLAVAKNENVTLSVRLRILEGS